MPAYKDTLDDFNLKWANTYSIYQGQLAYVVGARVVESEDEEGKIADSYVELNFDDSGQKAQRIWDFDYNCLTPFLVDSQLFNGVDLATNDVRNSLRMACVSVARSTRRQNRRSMSNENTKLSLPYHCLMGKQARRWSPEVQMSYSILERLKNPIFPRYADALQLCWKNLMVAISPSFAVALSTISTTRYLFASQFGFIGEADENNLYIKHKGSLQEVRDFVSRHSLALRVIDAGT